MKYFYLFIIFIIFSECSSEVRYKNNTLSPEERVHDLLGRMTLEEKIAQMQSININDTNVFDSMGYFTGDFTAYGFQKGTGSISLRNLRRNLTIRANAINSMQKYLLENSRLGIPSFFFSEALHGFMAEGATSFPQAIALGSTWDTALVEQIFAVAALEARISGTNQVLSPVLDLARDPRWGRTEECYSEDPYLTSQIALASVRGLQGRNFNNCNEHVAVTLKHFAGHGQPEGGRNTAPVNYSEREFRSTHLYPFEVVVKKAKAQSLMASYNEWDGVPNHINHKLLTGILRNEWGFDGYVMSDGGGIDMLYEVHLAGTDSADAGLLCIKAGCVYDLGNHEPFAALAEQIKNGKISEKEIDEAVRGILLVKFRMGLFENPYADVEKIQTLINSREHKKLALKAGHEALVLLKNENNVLPLDSTKIKSLAVIGPNAADIHLGAYSFPKMKGVSVLEGIQKFAGNRFKVEYAEGCKLTLNKECNWLVGGDPILNDPVADRKLIAEAVKVAAKSDAIVLVLGENEIINREAWSETHRGDADNLNLVGQQNELAKAMLETGKPVIVILINGRPLSVNYLAENVHALMECWYLGQETGSAVADALFGRINPSGKLTVTFPRSVGQLPCYYNMKPSRNRTYTLAESKPLFPFGFGLSYTQYHYSNLKISADEIKTNENVQVSVAVTNTGKVAGDEIVQLYIHDLVSMPVRPVQELKDFSRIHLEADETKTINFNLTPEKLEAYNLNMIREVTPGKFEIMVGSNSVEYLSDTLLVSKP